MECFQSVGKDERSIFLFRIFSDHLILKGVPFDVGQIPKNILFVILSCSIDCDSDENYEND